MFLSEKQITRKKEAQLMIDGFQYMNEEYNNIDAREELTSVTLPLANDDLHPGYNRIPGGCSTKQKSLCESFRKAIWTSISMAFSLFPPTAFTIIFLYVDLNTADLCREWQHLNNTVPLSVTVSLVEL